MGLSRLETSKIQLQIIVKTHVIALLALGNFLRKIILFLVKRCEFEFITGPYTTGFPVSHHLSKGTSIESGSNTEHKVQVMQHNLFAYKS